MMSLDGWWAFAQGALGAIVVVRMLRGVRSTTIVPAPPPAAGSVSVLVPVLNEAARVEPCLRGLLAAGMEVGEIIVVDGGSHDGTIARVRALTAADPRVRVLDAAPVPDGWNGKAWGLDVGLRATSPTCSRPAVSSPRWSPTRDGATFVPSASRRARSSPRRCRPSFTPPCWQR
jgi:dolichol-phosphate mannosyltransferase